MPNTYSQMYVQIVFTVRGKINLISESIRENIEKYICGIITKNKCKPLAIYCNPDHVHTLLGLHPTISVSDLVREIKANSSRHINDNKFILGKFEWQDGFGSFTYSRTQIDKVVKYILNQPIHHKKYTFQEEYLSLLKKFEIEYNDKYLFEWYEK